MFPGALQEETAKRDVIRKHGVSDNAVRKWARKYELIE